MSDLATDIQDHSSVPASPPSPTGRPEAVATDDLVSWLTRQRDSITPLWSSHLRPGRDDRSGEIEALLREFVETVVSMLPGAFAPLRDSFDEYWGEVARLYGSFGAFRGLAAGEVVEEYQLLRECVLRRLYSDPPGRDGEGLSLHDALRLSRTIDRGVTQASIGHTDALFFALFRGSGVSEALSPELIAEVRSQLVQIRSEYGQLSGARLGGGGLPT